MPALSIITPTFRRPQLLKRLYTSLCRQNSCKDFEWIVVSDEHNADTARIMHGIAREATFHVVFLEKDNGGKHTAVNLGVTHACAPWMMVVDDDDLAVDGALADVISLTAVADSQNLVGVAGICLSAEGIPLSTALSSEYIDADAFEIRLKYKIYGDLVEVLRTDMVRRNPYPVFDGEKFMPEGWLLWTLTEKSLIRYTSTPILIREYPTDGLSSRFISLLVNSPQGTLHTYARLFSHHSQNFKGRLIAATCLHTYTLGSDVPWRQRIRASSPAHLLTVIPAALLRLFYIITHREQPLV